MTHTWVNDDDLEVTHHAVVAEQQINTLQLLGFTRKVAKEFLEAEGTKILEELDLAEREIERRLAKMNGLNGELVSKMTKYLGERQATVTVTDFKGERVIYGAE